jgi:flagellar FliL protein
MASDDENDTPEASGEEEGGNRKGKRLILIIVGLLALLGAGGAGLYFSGMLGGKKEEAVTSDEKKDEKTAPAKSVEEAKKGDPVFFELPEFINNLNTGSTQASFIKVTVILELASPEDLKRVEQMQPRVIDDFNTYLRELRASDLAGSAGLERLREELLRRVNKAVEPALVNNILFKEIIVQ